jgi:hypothetical protein
MPAIEVEGEKVARLGCSAQIPTDQGFGEGFVG